MWALQTQAWGSLYVFWSSLDMFSAYVGGIDRSRSAQ